MNRTQTFESLFPTQQIALPSHLRDIAVPPDHLYAQGNLQLLERLPQDGLGIVGTRNPQLRSVIYCENTIKSLQKSSLIIVSGLARGIDAIAHQQALETQLPTVAVLGAGLDCSYPHENIELRANILHSGGLLLSEYPDKTPPRGFQFLHRNRLIAGLSKATWIVEAAVRSGALNTAKWAREMNRLCFTVPCFPSDPYLAGNQLLIDRDHALPLYGPHNLGAAWLDLSHLKVTQPVKSENRSQNTKIKLLIAEIAHQKYTQGGVTLSELRTWAFSMHWTSSDFYSTLNSAIQFGQITQRNAVLVTH